MRTQKTIPSQWITNQFRPAALMRVSQRLRKFVDRANSPLSRYCAKPSRINIATISAITMTTRTAVAAMAVNILANKDLRIWFISQIFH